MKGLIYSSLSALLLATATGVMPGTTQKAPAQMVFNFNAPVITDSGILGSSHFIKVAVLGMSLQDLMISLPSQMEPFESVQVTDRSGKEIPAKITMSPGNVTITFAQPVTPDTMLKVEFTGVRMSVGYEGTILYGVTGQRVGLKEAIPIGTALVTIPGRS